MASALERFRVVDLSESIAGQYCCRLLSDFGARTVVGEPEAGSRTRRVGPFDAVGGSLTFHHLNLGKTVESLPDRGREAAVDRLCRDADVVVTASAAEADRLRARHPECVALDVSTFGSDGPLSHWKGPEIVMQALSGMMSNNGTAGQQPLFGVGNRAAYAAGVAGFISVLGALYARGTGAGGQRCSVDTAETAAAMAFPYVLQYEYNGTDRRRGDQEIPAGQVLCRGTWVCIWVYPFRFAAMCRTLGLDACIDDPRFADPEVRSRNWDALFDIIQDKIADRDADEVVRELQAAQVIAACAYRPGELMENPHLEARGYWGFTGAETGHRRYLGPPFRLSRTPRGALAAVARSLPEEVTA